MTIAVKSDWWKTLFDEIYLVTDARTVRDDVLTRKEIDAICRLIPIVPGDRILDLCGGQGRHAIELQRRGCGPCTVLDYALILLSEGRKAAEGQNLPVTFVQGDARETPLAASAFDVVMVLGNSLGYSAEKDADLRILQECRRLLKRDGRLLLDVTDGGAVRQKLAPNAWHEIGDDVVVCRQREIRQERVCARELVMSKTRGIIRDRTYGIRLYEPRGLGELVARAGFVDIRINADQGPQHRGEDRGCMNHRLVVVARKP
ncbi:MAG: class I SAM-dependent methyltransferase [Desulfobacterales bacterium]|jgi:D-alanine-D-alanine ligase